MGKIYGGTGVSHNIKKIYMGGNKDYKYLPSQYTQLEYIQSDMMNYFDSGVEVSSGLKIVADFQLLYKQYGYEFCLFGTVDNDSSGRGLIRCVIATDNTFIAESSTYSQSSDIYARTIVTSQPPSDRQSSNQTVYIFAQHQNNLPYATLGICKLYSLKIYNNNLLIKEYVPALRKLDNEIGLYDTINNQFLEKVSSISSEYQQVEYLEGTGTQYIDTGYKAVTNTGFFIKFLNNDEIGESNVGAIFGACNSSYTGYYVDTWTNNSNKGSFRKAGDLYDAGLVKNTILIRNHSTVTNTLTNGDTSHISTNTTSNTTPVSMYIFAYNKEDSGVISRSKTKLYLLAFIEQYKPIHIYAPVIRKLDNKPGMYDIIEQEFLINSGTEEFLVGQEIKAFTAGPELFQQNVAHNIKNVYVGVNGIAKLIYSDDILPNLYQQVDYIQSSGTQWINTGYNVNGDTNLKVIAKAALVTNIYSNGDGYLFGGAGSNQRFYVLIKNESDTNKRKIRIGLGKGYWTDSSVANTNIHTYEVDMKNLKVYVDGSSKAKNSSNAYSRNIYSNNMTIFCTYNYNADNAIKAKLYSFKLYSNNILYRDYYPCYRKTDGVVGLYDMCNKQFYTNSGTGVFTIGPKVNKVL